MSAVKGVYRTLMDTPTPVNRLDAGLHDGRVKVSHDYYEANSLAAGSTIDIGGTLPTNCYVIGILLSYDVLGSATIDVGDDEDTDRYVNDLSVSSAGSNFTMIADGHGYKVDMTTSSTPDNQVVITTASAAISGTIKASIFYVHD